MILTITPNPSLDLLFEANRLVWDDANRVDAPRRRIGGQGINVTRAARALGAQSAAVALLGGTIGNQLENMLAAEATPYHRIDIAGETRLFVGAREVDTGRSLLLNPRGPTIAQKQAGRITQEVSGIIARERPAWVAACGSIPPGLPRDFYATVAHAAAAAGARFVVDCDGEALRNAAPMANLLVPNQHEAERLTQLEINSDEALLEALSRLRALGPQTVAITLGARGAALADAAGAWLCEPPDLRSGSAVGAGDAFLAALILGLDRCDTLDRCLRAAVGAGSAVLLSKGGDLIQAADARELAAQTKVRPL